MLPEFPGLTKQAVLIKREFPVVSNVPGRVFGSQTRSKRAFISPPVKSVIVVEAHVVVEPGCKTNPAAQASPALMEYVPRLEGPLQITRTVPKVLGFPLASKWCRKSAMFEERSYETVIPTRLSFGMS